MRLYVFPREHRRKLRSTTPLERVNRDIGRRSDVVGIFATDRVNFSSQEISEEVAQLRAPWKTGHLT